MSAQTPGTRHPETAASAGPAGPAPHHPLGPLPPRLSGEPR